MASIRRFSPGPAAAASDAGLHELAVRGRFWVEVGDTGDVPMSAQLTDCPGEPVAINGNLDTTEDVDMYCVTIHDIAAFTATTCVRAQLRHPALALRPGRQRRQLQR